MVAQVTRNREQWVSQEGDVNLEQVLQEEFQVLF